LGGQFLGGIMNCKIEPKRGINTVSNVRRSGESKPRKRIILSHKNRFAYGNTDDFLRRLFSLNEQGALAIGGKRIC